MGFKYLGADGEAGHDSVEVVVDGPTQSSTPELLKGIESPSTGTRRLCKMIFEFDRNF
jgi:hypothetical protein